MVNINSSSLLIMTEYMAKGTTVKPAVLYRAGI